MTSKEKKILKSNLPKSYAEVIAKECDVSERYVRAVLNHPQKNETIFQCIIELAEKEKEKREQQRQRILKLQD